jgi:hypothetical protein
VQTDRRSRSMNTKGGGDNRSADTMTSPPGFAKMAGMRNLMVMAIVAIGAVRIVWRVLSPAQPPTFATDWAADE